MVGAGFLVALLLSSSPQLPALVGQRLVLGDRHVFDREVEVAIAVPLEKDHVWSITLELDGKQLSFNPSVQSGAESQVLRFKISRGDHGSGTLVLFDNKVESKRWQVAVLSLADDSPEVAAAEAARKDKKFTEALALLKPLLDGPLSAARVWAETERGNISYMNGDRVATETWWVRASKSAAEAGIHSEIAKRMNGVAHLRYERGAFIEAEEAIAEARRALDGVDVPLLSVECNYHLGALRFKAGEHMAAARILRPVVEEAEFFGLETTRNNALQILALALKHLGSFRESLKIFDQELEEKRQLSPDARSYYYFNRGSTRLAAMEAGILARDLELVRSDYKRALEVIEQQGIPQRMATIRTWLAKLELVEGDLEAAERELAHLDGKPLESFETVRWDARLVRAELLLKQGRLDEAKTIADAVFRGAANEQFGKFSETVWAAMTLLADVQRERGKKSGAIKQYREALDYVDDVAVRLAVPRGQAFKVLQGRNAVESLARLLLDEKKTAEAFSVLARAQSGALEDLEAAVRVDTFSVSWRPYRQAREELTRALSQGCGLARPSERKLCEAKLRRLKVVSEAALSAFYAASGSKRPIKEKNGRLLRSLQAALAKDESLLAIFRLRDQWITFFVGKHSLKHEVGDAPSKSWIARAKKEGHIYILLGDRTESLEPHLYEGPDKAPVAAAYSMSYLPSGSALLARRKRPSGPALVIADPDGTLPSARTAGKKIASKLADAFFLAGTDATRRAITRELGGRSVFHFIGHASLLDGDPWTTELRLAGGESLGVADVLSMRADVGVAVLEGCTTGPTTTAGELGLPQVMIAAGAQSVLATVRDLDAGEATQFLSRFYDAGGPKRPAYAFREAIRISREKNDPSWQAFRLWGQR